MTIEIGKQYRTRGGQEVRIYATDGDEEMPVHGAVLTKQGWRVDSWTLDGKWCQNVTDAIDLVEVRPRIKREFWVNVYPHRIGSPNSSEGYAKAHRGADAIACVRVEIDVEEGHGL